MRAAAVSNFAPQAATRRPVNYSAAAWSGGALTRSVGADAFLSCSVIPDSPSASGSNGLFIALLVGNTNNVRPAEEPHWLSTVQEVHATLIRCELQKKKTEKNDKSIQIV